MSTTEQHKMSWDEIRAELARIEQTPQGGLGPLEDAVARLDAILERLRELCAHQGLTAPPPHLEETAGELERHLRVGAIPMPSTAPAGLAAQLRPFEERLISPALLREFPETIAAFTKSAQTAAADAVVLETRLTTAQRHRDLLVRYRTALDALTRIS